VVVVVVGPLQFELQSATVVYGPPLTVYPVGTGDCKQNLYVLPGGDTQKNSMGRVVVVVVVVVVVLGMGPHGTVA